jgi:hypothetical protein
MRTVTTHVAHARGIGAACLLALWLGGCDAPGTTPVETAPATTTPTVAAPAPATPPATAAPGADTGFVALDASVVAATDSFATLQARLGAGNVVAGQVPGAEGEEFAGWIVFPDDPARRLHVYLDDAGAHPSLLRVLDRESRWQRSDGIRMGVTLAELAARNGAPVGFTGFDWDYGGSCCDWHGGRLERDPPTGGMTLCPPVTDATAGPGYPMGDAQFDSNHPWVVAHPPAVCEFAVALAPPAPPEGP